MGVLLVAAPTVRVAVSQDGSALALASKVSPGKRRLPSPLGLDGPHRSSYAYYIMDAVLTARLPVSTLERLRERARRTGTTPSRIVRNLLDRELGPPDEDVPALERTRRWVGAVRSVRVTRGRDVRAALRVWHPDRRA